MKRTSIAAMIIAVLVCLAIPGASVFALDDIVLPAGGSFYDGKTLQPQYDSTTDTVATAYTPRYVGDFLVGQTDGSNSLWVATSISTAGWAVVTTCGGPFSAADIEDDAVTEAKLKAVDAASDEDFLSYESTTGDFEWHSAAELQAKFTEGSYADSTVLSADIKNGEIVDADISASAAIAHTKLASISPAYLLVGSAASKAVAVEVSGDVSMATNGAVTIANDAVTAAKMGVVHQADTNDVTVILAYTPAFIGQVLIGQTGPGTNLVCVSKGVTTNDWVQVAP